MTRPATAPHPFTDVLASPRAAADLCGVPELIVLGWIAERRLRVVRLQGRDVVRLDLVAELAAGAENPPENSEFQFAGVPP